MFKNPQNFHTSSIPSQNIESSSQCEDPSQRLTNQRKSTSQLASDILDYGQDDSNLNPSESSAYERSSNQDHIMITSQEIQSVKQWEKQVQQPSIKYLINNTTGVQKQQSISQNQFNGISQKYPVSSSKLETFSLQRINHKKMLSQQILRSKQLQQEMDRKCEKLIDSYQLISKLKEQNSMLLKMLKKQRQTTQKNKSEINKIDKQILNIKKKNRIADQKSVIADRNYDFCKKERKRLQQQNQKYKVFVQGLCESMKLLTGHKVQGMTKLWEQWTKLFKQLNFYRTQQHNNI